MVIIQVGRCQMYIEKYFPILFTSSFCYITKDIINPCLTRMTYHALRLLFTMQSPNLSENTNEEIFTPVIERNQWKPAIHQQPNLAIYTVHSMTCRTNCSNLKLKYSLSGFLILRTSSKVPKTALQIDPSTKIFCILQLQFFLIYRPESAKKRSHLPV